MEYILETNNLCKEYGNYKALDHVDMHIPKGSIYGFIGKNGAGKTTMIRLICGIQFPASGELILYGKKHTEKGFAQVRRNMGAVVETPSIYLDMTAKQNLKQQYRILGLPSFDGIQELLNLVGIGDTGKKKSKDFSLGMRQRLGIAIALAGNPDFLILDEPTNGLDPQGIIELRELILKLHHEYHITVLISSHILTELSKLATHYGFIDQGNMVKEMTSEELKTACRTCIHIDVSDTGTLATVLDSMNIEYHITSSTQADIYSNISISKLVLALDHRNCEVFHIWEQEENLEHYFVDLVGGEHYV